MTPKITPWPALLQYLISVIVVVGFGWLCENVSFYFYPLALFFIGSRIYAVTLIGHEGIHQLLFKNKKMNLIFARYFCHFPAFISSTFYGRLHLLHHRYLATAQDPDLYLYVIWKSKIQWFKKILIILFNGQSVVTFSEYFNGLPQLLKNKYHFRGDADYAQMGVFWIMAAILLSFLGAWKYLFFYWFLPFYFWFPWLQLINQLHHSGAKLMPDVKARNLAFRYSFLEPIFFPLNINLHETHHRDSSIPFHQLRQAANAKNMNSYLVSDLEPVIFNGQ